MKFKRRLKWFSLFEVTNQNFNKEGSINRYKYIERRLKTTCEFADYCYERISAKANDRDCWKNKSIYEKTSRVMVPHVI